MPSGASASATAFMIGAVPMMQPDSPTPLKPSGFSGDGHAGSLERARGVDRENSSVGVGAADHGGVQHAGQRDVADVAPVAWTSRGSSLRRSGSPMNFTAAVYRNAHN